MSILVVGSVALDSVRTPFGNRREILGGSATYFSVAASFFKKVDLIATVGKDFPEKYITMFKKRGIGTSGLHVAGGKTFRWKGCYDYDLNTARTLSTHLNVFKDFRPDIPKNLRTPEFLFLANIDPELQREVLRQVKRPKFIACDSMNYWIENKKKELVKLLHRLDIFFLNDSEARQFSGESNILKAAKYALSLGPRAVIIKRGEHGAVYFSRRSHFVAPAYLLESLYDPTGAGDTFAGGMVGYLSRRGSLADNNVRKAIIYGSILASFAVEDFSVNRLLKINQSDINKRYRHYCQITRF